RRRHTRFSRDWSSDVCSSDLFLWAVVIRIGLNGCIFDKVIIFTGSILVPHMKKTQIMSDFMGEGPAGQFLIKQPGVNDHTVFIRSEERRVGKEGRSRRWSSAS